MKKRSSVFNVVMIIGLTFLAKIIGFARDAFIGYRMGASNATDSYFAAIGITTIVFLGIGGAIATNTIPIVVRYRKEKEGEESISNILSAIILFSVIGTGIYYLIAPIIVPFLVPGYDAEQLKLTVQITRWMLPTLLFISVMYFYVGVLQANEKFVLPATSSFLFNIVFFVYIGLYIDDFGVVGLAIVTTLGWLIQLIYLLPSVIKNKLVPFRLRLDLKDPILRNFLIGIVPIALVTLTHQFNIIFDNQQASMFGQGNVSAIYYGNMLFVAIVTVTVNGITAVMFPKFNEKLLEKNHEGFYQSVVNVLRSISLLLIPMSVGMILVGPHIISVVFERGLFDAKDTLATVIAFSGYTSLMLAFGFVDVLNKAYYALNNRRTPVLIGVIITMTNLGLNFVLTKVMGYAGIPIATSIAFYVGALTSFALFYRMEKGFVLGRFANSMMKVLLAALAMGIGVYLMDTLMSGMMEATAMGSLIIVVVDITVGILVYGGMLIALKEQLVYHNMKSLLKRLRRKA